MRGFARACAFLLIFDVGYYLQAIRGEFQILVHRHSIEKLIANSKTPVTLKQQLELVRRLRTFAGTELKLLVDGNYEKYADVHRKYVVWNVQAAPPFSLEPKVWWYPFVGRLACRGYISEKRAREYGSRLAKQGFDVYVDGVEAYSTLGWFKDPLLNTFIYDGEPELAELLFHELAHKRVFANGDTDFNEAYATTVGREGAAAGYAPKARRVWPGNMKWQSRANSSSYTFSWRRASRWGRFTAMRNAPKMRVAVK